MKLISVYGTLRKGFGNHHFLADQKFVGTGLTDEKYTMRASGIPFVSKSREGDPKTQILIETYRVSERAFLSIDGLEGHPVFYKREVIPVTVEGVQLFTWLYFCEDGTGEIIESGDFSDHTRSYAL
jgi:gamma-glutamylaminecyclotransferase